MGGVRAFHEQPAAHDCRSRRRNSLCQCGRKMESARRRRRPRDVRRSEEHTSELQSHSYLVCRLLLEKKTYPAVIKLVRRSHGKGGASHSSVCGSGRGSKAHCRREPNSAEDAFSAFCLFFFLMRRRPPKSTIFPHKAPLRS